MLGGWEAGIALLFDAGGERGSGGGGGGGWMRDGLAHPSLPPFCLWYTGALLLPAHF